MQRSVSVRIEGVLAERERENIAHTVSSLGGSVVSLNARADVRRTYAFVRMPEGYDRHVLAHAVGSPLIDDPAVVVLEILPREPRLREALLQALGGPGGPSGVLAALRTPEGVLVELDAERTSPCLLLDVVDTELESAPGRRVLPILPLSDEVLTATARDLLNDPALDVSRLIETYTDALL